MQGQAGLGQLFAQLAHGAVGVHGLAAFGRGPALPLDESAAHGIVFHAEQGLAVGILKTDEQGVAVGGVVDDGAVFDVGKAHLQKDVVDAQLVPGVGFAAQPVQQARGTGLGAGAQQTGQHGGIGAVAHARGAQRAQQHHMDAGGAAYQIGVEGIAALDEVMPGAHGADGMGAGRAGADLEKVEERGLDGRTDMQGRQGLVRGSHGVSLCGMTVLAAGAGLTRGGAERAGEGEEGNRSCAPLQHIPFCLEYGDVSIFFNLKNILNSKTSHYFS